MQGTFFKEGDSRDVRDERCRGGRLSRTPFSFPMWEGLELTTPLQTALQMYCQQYKSPALAHTHALLRKARRLDQVLGSVADVLASSRTTPISNHTQCSRCKSNYAPMFYPTGANQWTCHKCHYESKEPGKHMNGTSVADVGRATA